ARVNPRMTGRALALPPLIRDAFDTARREEEDALVQLAAIRTLAGWLGERERAGLAAARATTPGRRSGTRRDARARRSSARPGRPIGPLEARKRFPALPNSHPPPKRRLCRLLAAALVRSPGREGEVLAGPGFDLSPPPDRAGGEPSDRLGKVRTPAPAPGAVP